MIRGGLGAKEIVGTEVNPTTKFPPNVTEACACMALKPIAVPVHISRNGLSSSVAKTFTAAYGRAWQRIGISTPKSVTPPHASCAQSKTGDNGCRARPGEVSWQT